MDISKIDKNFKVETKINKSDIVFYNVLEKPFKIYGLQHSGGKFRRMDEEVARRVSLYVYGLHSNTAGGRVRFKTDSPYIAINAKMEKLGKMPHFALTGSAGFDMYDGDVHIATFVPPFDIADGYEAIKEMGSGAMRSITINFPLYSDVVDLYIGLKEGSQILPADDYRIEKPIVYYGSSITQGGCASRPGAAYQSRISRELDVDFINLGFSGSAKAEDDMIEYLCGLVMSVFVCDYDHNAPNPEHLNKTHEKLFSAVRQANPNLPILILQRPRCVLEEHEKERLSIIRKTYENAKASGDENVYFIDGKTLLGEVGDEGTVDNCHPNDLGFYFMAKKLSEVLREILK